MNYMTDIINVLPNKRQFCAVRTRGQTQMYLAFIISLTAMKRTSGPQFTKATYSSLLWVSYAVSIVLI